MRRGRKTRTYSVDGLLSHSGNSILERPRDDSQDLFGGARDNEALAESRQVLRDRLASSPVLDLAPVLGEKLQRSLRRF